MSINGLQKVAKSSRLTLFAGLCTALLPQVTKAFPEMIRFGFESCQVCHVSPNGGGILTTAGQAIAASLLGGETKEGGEPFLDEYAKQVSPMLSLGADIRLLQAQKENARIKQGIFVVMQADLEIAYQREKLTLVGTIGQDSLSKAPYLPDGRLISRRHYALWQTPHPDLQLRVGRFNHPFGINVPDHIVATRAGLNWDYGSETYNFESIWQKQNYDVFFTLNLGRPDLKSIKTEKGVVARFRYNILPKTQLGLSYYFGRRERGESRHVYGPHLSIAFNDKWVLLEEIAFQEDFSKTETGHFSRKVGLFNYSKLSYELFRGLNVFAMEDFKKTAIKAAHSAVYSYGLGTQYFPRTHLELQLSFQRYEYESLRSNKEDLVYLMMHLWL